MEVVGDVGDQEVLVELTVVLAEAFHCGDDEMQDDENETEDVDLVVVDEAMVYEDAKAYLGEVVHVDPYVAFLYAFVNQLSAEKV